MGFFHGFSISCCCCWQHTILMFLFLQYPNLLHWYARSFGQLGAERFNFYSLLWWSCNWVIMVWDDNFVETVKGYVMHHMFNSVFLVFSSGVQNVWNWSFLEKVLPSGLWLNPTLSVIWILNFFLCFRDRWCVWIIVSYVWIVIFCDKPNIMCVWTTIAKWETGSYNYWFLCTCEKPHPKRGTK